MLKVPKYSLFRLRKRGNNDDVVVQIGERRFIATYDPNLRTSL